MNLPLYTHYKLKRLYYYLSGFLNYYYSRLFKPNKLGELIIIVGMHRSGTSAITSSIQRMGVPMGKNFSLPADENAKGFFEERELVNLHEELLSRKGSSWWSINLSTFNDNNNLYEYMCIYRFLFRRLSENKRYLIKDPRICLFLEKYSQLSKLFGFNIKLVYITRNTTTIVKSLNKRKYIFDKDKVDFVYLTDFYLKEVDKNKNNFQNIEVSFEKIMASPRTEMEKVSNFLFDENRVNEYNISVFDERLVSK